MKRKRRKFSAQEKVRILRRYFLDLTSVSDLCDENRISPTLFYRWQKELFENAESAFEKQSGSERRNLEKKIDKLQEKITYKDGVIVSPFLPVVYQLVDQLLVGQDVQHTFESQNLW